MQSNLIYIKDFLGKYYSELNYSSIQEKYKNTNLDTFFEQRFYIQNNKTQMIVDSTLKGLSAIVTGNEVIVSQKLYDHPNVIISNSIENTNQNNNPRSLYNAETFSTIAYLICQNHTMFHVIDEIDEPIYIKYQTEYEVFYNSVIVVEVSDGLSIEVVEEIESLSALNSVINYILHPNSNLKLTTFYQNHISGISFTYRNVIAQDNSYLEHIVLGKGSSNIIDENKIVAYSNSKFELLGIINSNRKNFHSIVSIYPLSISYSIDIDYRNISYDKGNVTFYPVIVGNDAPSGASISVTSLAVDEIEKDSVEKEIKKYIKEIIERTIPERVIGISRFIDNKTKFLQLL